MLSDLLIGGLIEVGFLAVLFLGSILLPGQYVSASSSANGTHKLYKLNGLRLFLVVTVVVAIGTLTAHLSLSFLQDYFWSLFIIANLFAILFTVLLYLKGRRTFAVERTSSSWLTLLSDLWFGVELNPTWWTVDLKMFAYQPSLIGLGLLNLSFAYVQYETYGQVSLQMILHQCFWWVYLLTHYWQEEFMLSTWDIIAEKFGFMLIWGDGVLVPFFYSIGGWFLIDSTAPMPTWAVVSTCLLYGFGLALFRGANLQKYRFKKNPNTNIWGKPAQTIDGKLLISGWWGVGRKLNYTGEILVYLAIASTTGTHSIVPYLLPLWLCILLPHRAWRDEQRCQKKYGQLWDKYCAKVQFRMLPFVY